MGDVVDRSDELDRRIAGSDEIAAVVRYAHTSRRLIRIVAASVALVLLLTVGVGYLGWQSYMLAQQATSIQQQQRVACLSGNTARAGQRQLWHYLLDMPPAAPRTPAQQQQVDNFAAYIDRLFAPRVCQ